MAKYEVGQELRVFPVQSRRYNKVPDDGFKGEVVNVARKYMTVAFRTSEGGWLQEEVFELATGRGKATGYGHGYNWIAKTPQEVEEDARKALAWRMLNEIGLERKGRGPSSLTLEQLEALAEVISNHPAFETIRTESE